MPLLYFTTKTNKQAEKIVNQLLKEKLIVCGNIQGNVKSMYLWKQKKYSEKEILIFAKTNNKNKAKAMQRITELHPYEVPAIYAIEVESMNAACRQWIDEELL